MNTVAINQHGQYLNIRERGGHGGKHWVFSWGDLNDATLITSVMQNNMLRHWKWRNDDKPQIVAFIPAKETRYVVLLEATLND